MTKNYFVVVALLRQFRGDCALARSGVLIKETRKKKDRYLVQQGCDASIASLCRAYVPSVYLIKNKTAEKQEGIY